MDGLVSKGLKIGGWGFNVGFYGIVTRETPSQPRSQGLYFSSFQKFSCPKKRKNDPGYKVTLKCHQDKNYLRQIISMFLYEHVNLERQLQEITKMRHQLTIRGCH